MRPLFALLALALLVPAAIAEEAPLHPELADFAPYIGKTYRGDLTQPGAEKQSVDIQHWERILNGKGIRVTHSINDGEYGGESLLLWDAGAGSLVYYYFTTEGFYTHGTMTLDGGSFSTHEYVEGETGGVTEVRSRGEFHEDGRLTTTSEYMKDGEWVPGHSATYVEAPDAEVIFR